jgi:hypothetical protein
MEAICFSEKSVDFQRTTQCYIPEYSILQVLLYLVIMIILFLISADADNQPT